MRKSGSRILLAACFCLTLLSLGAAEKPQRGIGLWRFEGAAKGLESLNVSWYYNWKAESDLDTSIEFVPMIWGADDVNEATLLKAKQNGDTLLGFNEPDIEKQANMSVEDALRLWPQLEATKMRLGSPAVAKDAHLGDSWFGKFMQGAQLKGYRVDFICVHNYQPNFNDPVRSAKKLQDYLFQVHEMYGKPIWLTEFCLANWKRPASAEQQANYMREALSVINELSFVERYAWFALPPNEKGDDGTLVHSNLSNNEGDLNTLGIIYKYFR